MKKQLPEIKPLTSEEKQKAKQAKIKDQFESILPVPESSPDAKFSHHEYGEPKVVYTYKNESGELLGYACRYEFTDSEGKKQKQVLPLNYFRDKETGKQKWQFKMWTCQRPIYRLEKLARKPDAKVVIVEGEKSADAGNKSLPEYVWVTSSGGSNAASKSDWSALKGREVTIWRDNDTQGEVYQESIIPLLQKAGVSSISILKLPSDLPAKFDVADAVEQGWNKDKIKKFIKECKQQTKILPTISIEELAVHNIPERKFYFPWLREGSLNMVYAKRGLGKTFFCLGVATALSNGTSFLKWENNKAAGVLYIDGEMTLFDIQSRFRGFIPTMKTNASLEILSHEELFNIEETDLNMVEEELQKRLQQFLDSRPDIRVAIFDNLSCLFPSLREDKRDDWVDKVLPLLMWFRRRNIAVILVHHTNKRGDQRGSGAKEDTLDTVIVLSPLPESEDNRGAGFFVEFTKSRNVFGSEVEPIEAKLMRDENGLVSWEWKEKLLSNEERLIELVQSGISTVKDAAIELGITEGAVSKIKQKLINKGAFIKGTKLKLSDDE